MFAAKPPPPPPQPDPEPEEEPDPGLPVEFKRVINHRRECLLSEGWPEDEALELAALFYIDWHEADAMRKAGCPFQTILEILT